MRTQGDRHRERIRTVIEIRNVSKTIWIGEIMKLSVETKVAAFVAAGFVALSVGVIAEGNGEDQRANPTGRGVRNNPEITMQMSLNGYNHSLADRTNAEENRHRTEW
jgi:hypothetical protein